MKKQLVSGLAILMLLAAGCGKNAPDPNARPTTGSSTPGTPAGAGPTTGTGPVTGTGPGTPPGGTPDPVKKPDPVKLGPLKPGTAGKLGDLELTLKSFEVINQAAGLPPGYIFILLNIGMTNSGTVDYPMNFTDHIRFFNPEGKKLSTSAQATGQRTPRLGGTVTKATPREGYLGYLTKNVPGTFKLSFTQADVGEATWEFTIQ